MRIFVSKIGSAHANVVDVDWKSGWYIDDDFHVQVNPDYRLGIIVDVIISKKDLKQIKKGFKK